uniref:Endo/exonuclease/phosphatase domain-containing protein n=1 Tax=Ascaris lumbricoides TaxID=6252 RepID=A0A0M3HJQ7_ASCLU
MERSYQLQWEYRSNLLARELLMISADIFCLQEVQEDHFHNFYLPVLARGKFSNQKKGKKTRMLVVRLVTFLIVFVWNDYLGAAFYFDGLFLYILMFVFEVCFYF